MCIQSGYKYYPIRQLIEQHVELMEHGVILELSESRVLDLFIVNRIIEYKSIRYLDVTCNGEIVSITIQ